MSYDFATDKFVLANDLQGIPEPPTSANYVRQLGAWQALSSATEITTLSNRITNIENLPPVEEAPINGTPYIRRDEAWETLKLEKCTDTLISAPVEGELLAYTSGKWSNVTPPNNFPEAPTDGSNYLRNGQSASWTALASDPGQVAQDGRLDAIEAEQITQNGDILNL